MKKAAPHLIKAVSLNSNKFVQACAGGGKTFAISKRYCAILDSFTADNFKYSGNNKGVENILVITFTNQAAAEMSERIYKDLNTLLNGEEIEPFKGAGIAFGQNIRRAADEYKNRLRSNFSQNSISTIDAFCAKILRANAYKTELDPKFKLGDEVTGKRFFEETLNEFLQIRSKNFDENLKVLLQNISPAKIEEFLKYIYYQRAFLDSWLTKWKGFIKSSNDEIIKNEWIKNYTPDFNVSTVMDILTGILNSGIGMEVKDETDKGYIAIQELKKNLDLFSWEMPPVEQKCFLLLFPLQVFLKKDGGYYQKFSGNKDKWKNPKQFKEFKNYAKEAMEELKEICPEEFYKQVPADSDFAAIPVLKSLLNLYTDFEIQLDKVKRQHNYLDFDDVIIKVRDLLKNDAELRTKLQKQYSHIMVDEFQDTNELRWEIVRLLA
ncbi:MAG: UvrD-helicase domain-containing protein, partial [Calditrichia bacterium]|nr:UvrD-helicase domain-containing protein [Calditrichia bacterium]